MLSTSAAGMESHTPSTPSSPGRISSLTHAIRTGLDKSLSVELRADKIERAFAVREKEHDGYHGLQGITRCACVGRTRDAERDDGDKHIVKHHVCDAACDG